LTTISSKQFVFGASHAIELPAPVSVQQIPQPPTCTLTGLETGLGLTLGAGLELELGPEVEGPPQEINEAAITSNSTALIE
jgi:hypothetical protein